MTGLVLEGGTFRGIFSAGVMDAFLEAGIESGLESPDVGVESFERCARGHLGCGQSGGCEAVEIAYAGTHLRGELLVEVAVGDVGRAVGRRAVLTGDHTFLREVGA